MAIQFRDLVDVDRPERYVFGLKVDRDLFSFLLYDPDEAGSGCYSEIPNKPDSDAGASFKQFFFDHPFLASPFRKTYILNSDPELTFVPGLLYREEDARSYLQFNLSDFNGKILSQHLRSPQLAIVHRMPDETFRFLNRSFPQARFIHRLSPVISWYQSKAKATPGSQLIVDLRNKQLDVICFSCGNFVYANCFRISCLQDAVYYVLFIWKQLKLNQLKDVIYLSGECDERAQLSDELTAYIRQIIPIGVPRPAQFRNADSIGGIPLDLACLTDCDI